ncbi:MAG: transcription-repair coupling factor [Gemmatimonadota bacterium]
MTVRRLPGASAAALAAVLSERSPAPVVLVGQTPNEADADFADLRWLAGDVGAGYFPQRESLPTQERDPHVEISSQRVKVLGDLLGGRARAIVTTARALAERVPLPASTERFELRLETGQRIGLGSLKADLQRMGFEAVHTVRELGEFAVRGGIVDVMGFGHERPLRIELWEDEIASLRRFDLLTQRSVDLLDRAEILPVRLPADGEGGDAVSRRSLVELLPEETLLIERDPSSGAALRRRLWEETLERHPSGSAAEGGGADSGPWPAEALVMPPEAAERKLSVLRRLAAAPEGEARRDGGPSADGEEPPEDEAGPGFEPPPRIDRDMERLLAEIRESLGRGERPLILCDSEGQVDRLEEILSERGGRLSERVTLALGSLSGGFRVRGPRPLLVLTDHEIFRRSYRFRRRSRFHGAATLESIASIKPGHYVVHMDHGIGRYRGLRRVRVGDETIETLEIEYAEGEILRLPHYRLDLIERWSAPGEDGIAQPPRVHRLGGKRWKQLRDRTVAAIEESALELLQLSARRHLATGHSFSGESAWQRVMESAFVYEETPDQLAAWEQVREDMERPRPMDRLVCGDVGFGKTEIAMRAAFKAVQDGKQVALLAPTTILVEQHLRTFQERLAAFPARIESLSRFRTPAEQRKTLQGLRSGRVDIVVGTHRLLSIDVRFRDLGLLIVDEEQRFGVKQKERLKALKESVDVLTLTATPIPRTLHLALGGLRDLSVIQTAPQGRMPVITHVLPWDDSIIQDAIRRERDRGGQVFFVHDRVETIESLTRRIRRLVPECAVDVAHGQMGERALEGVMAALLNGDIDVLVCTSIIENGLDIPTANTMIVHRADRFGLAQLYQLRGRVGRSHRRAHCYMIVPTGVSPEAERRLRILEHHTELGAGYQVALRDLQLRGAGNLLGAEQSGFATAVGLETYRRLVEKTVRRLRGDESGGKDVVAQVSIGGEAYLPDDYILDSEQKMNFYRRLSQVAAVREVAELRDELRDRYGPAPEPVNRLLAAAELRVLGTRLGVEWIRLQPADAGARPVARGPGAPPWSGPKRRDSARISFRETAIPRLSLLRGGFADRQVEVEVRRLQPLSLVLQNAGTEPLLSVLVEAFRKLATAEGSPASATAVQVDG